MAAGGPNPVLIMPPRSKRQRKAKNLSSLRAKAGGGTAREYGMGGGLDVAMTDLDGGDAAGDGGVAVPDLDLPGAADPADANALILPARAAKAASTTAPAAAAALPPPKRLSKSAARKARRVEEERIARAARSAALATLAAHALPPEHRALLRSTASLGQAPTKKQRLRRDLAAERLGVALDPGSDLLRDRGRPEEGTGPDGGGLAHLATPARPPGPAPPSPSPSDSESDDDGSRSPSPPPEPLSPTATRAAAAAARAELGLPAPGEGMGDEDDADGAALRPHTLPLAPGPARVVSFADTRPPALAAARAELPISGMEQEVMEAVAGSDVLLLAGETGSGKTTQVPQFLLEAGHGCADHPDVAGGVCVTQPRRVAAAAAAARVAAELGVPLGGLVGYQVRHDRRTAGASTRCKFVTDGILLRELASDFLLSSYSAIIVDEAHERSLNTDLLLGLLSRVVSLRHRLSSAGAPLPDGAARPALAARLGGRVRPLKLIIMSATLRLDDFAANPRLFAPPPPVIHVPARQYPVTIHFARRSAGEREYAAAAVAKAAQIHTTLPPGGILVFLTGRREVDWAVAKMRRGHGVAAGREEGAAAAEEGDAHPPPDLAGGDAAEDAAADVAADAALRAAEAAEGDGAGVDDYEAGQALSDEEETWQLGGGGFTPAQVAEAEAAFEARTGVDLAAIGGGGGGGGGAGGGAPPPTAADAAAAARPANPMHVLPLYAALPRASQDAVFAPPPPGARLVVVATNVAETSLTIPGIRYVVDAGRAKARTLSRAGERGAAVARYEVGWVSQASADQRAGRAGRTGPGHCYRLFSAAVYGDTLPLHAPAEVEAAPLEGVALALRALGVDRVANFPFPTPPDRAALARADGALLALGALEAAAAASPAAPPRLTPVGRAMAALPISPRHARALLEVGRAVAAGEAKPRALAAAVALAAVLSVESPFLADGGGDEKEEAGAEGEGGGDEPDAARRRAHRASVRAAQARLRDESGDALSALAALAGFEDAVGAAAGGSAHPRAFGAPRAVAAGDAFCRAHGLAARHLREAAALRAQLAGIVGRAAGEAAAAPGHPLAGLPPSALAALQAPPPASPPSPSLRTALLRGLVAGWADQVGRRVRSDGAITAAAATAGRARAVRYEPCAPPAGLVGGGGGGDGSDPLAPAAAAAAAAAAAVFLHPRSALGRRAPEWVVYADLVASAKRVYMAGVSAIDPAWLAGAAPGMTALEAPGKEVAARFDRARDAAVAPSAATYGPRGWTLPPVIARHPDATARSVAFAEALLAGRALPALGALLAPWLVEPPAALRRAGALGVRRVGDLVRALAKADVDGVAKLRACWSADPAFLRRELGGWVRPAGVAAFEGGWAGVVGGVACR